MTALVIILVFLLVTAVVILHWRGAVSRLLTASIAFMIGLWYVLPVFVSIVWREQAARFALAPYDTFMQYAAIESFALLVALLFLFAPRPYYRLLLTSRPSRQFPPWLTLLGLGVAAFMTIGIARLMQGALGMSYNARNAFMIVGAGSSAFNSLGTFMFVQTLLTCFAYAAVLSEWPSKTKTRLIHLAAAAIVMYMTLELLQQGSRLALITPATLFLLYAVARRWRTRTIFVIGSVVVIASVVVAAVASVVIANQRGNEALKTSEALSESDRMVEREGTDRIIAEFIDHLAIKFDNFSSGSVLVNRFGAGTAGNRPLLGSFVSVIPRQLLTSKPVPGSVDGTYVGHPSRLVAIALGFNPFVASVGVGPVAVSVWQYGFVIGPLVIVMLAVPYLYLLNSLLLPNSVFTRTLGVFLIGIPAYLGVFPTLDALIMNVERVAVIFIGTWIVLAGINLFLTPAPRNHIRRVSRQAAA